MKTLDEWKKIYFDKTGVEFEDEDGFITFYHPIRGFCQYAINQQNKRLAVNHTCGDGEFWRDFAWLLAKQNSLKIIETLICRKPEAYFRAMHWTIQHIENLPSEKNNYYGTDENGNNVCAKYYMFNHETGRDLYHIMKEV